MKQLVFAITLITIAVGGTAFAQDPYRDNIGMYYDIEGTVMCNDETLEQGLYESALHLVMTDVTSNVVAGWEARIIAEGPITLFLPATDGLLHSAINVGSGEEYIVGLGEPQIGSTILLANFSIYVSGADEPGLIYIDGVFQHSLPNRVPAYVDGTDPENMIEKPLHQSTGGASDPVLYVNGECVPVGVEQSTFGGVKSLFR